MNTKATISYLLIITFVAIAYLWHRHNQKRYSQHHARAQRIRQQLREKHKTAQVQQTAQPQSTKDAESNEDVHVTKEAKSNEDVHVTKEAKSNETVREAKSTENVTSTADVFPTREEAESPTESESVGQEPVDSCPLLSGRNSLEEISQDTSFLKRHLSRSAENENRHAPPQAGDLTKSEISQEKPKSDDAREDADNTAEGDQRPDARIKQAFPVTTLAAEDAEEHSAASAEVEEDEKADEPKALELKSQGNVFFKAGKHEEALAAYNEALEFLPKNSLEQAAIIFSNMAAVHLAQQNWEAARESASSAIEIQPSYSKSYLRRYKAHAGLEKIHDAVADLKKACELDDAIRSTYRLELSVMERKSAAQFEKEKEEMMGKLKEFGNWALGKVGMSIDQFQVVQDPATGSYNIQYKPQQQAEEGT